MDGVLATVEQACREFNDPATSSRAEQVLLQFRKSAQPLTACQYILEHSNSVDARFHAACTLREAAVREWSSLDADGVLRLRTYLLQYTLRHAAEPALNIVRAVLIASLAVLLKRGWLQETAEERARFLQEIQATVHSVGSAAAQRVGVELLTAVVTEFSLATASPLGLAWDYHDQCCRDLEAHYLKGLFRHAVSLASGSCASGAAVSGADQGLCAACMALMTAILGWDFRRTALAGTMVTRRGAGDQMQVAPGFSWSQTLMPDEATGWLVALLRQLTGQASPLAAAARQLLVALCSLSGAIVLKNEAGELVAGYLRQMLRGVLPLIHPADAALKHALHGDETQLMDACKAISALANTHKLQALEVATAEVVGTAGSDPASDVNAGVASTSGRHHGSSNDGGRHSSSGGSSSFVRMLEALTLLLVRSGGMSEDGEHGSWMHECTHMLIEAWVHLTRSNSSLSIVSAQSLTGPDADGVLSPWAVEAAGHVYCALVDAALQDAASGAHDDTEVADEAGAAAKQDDWLCQAALLARCSPAASFCYTAKLLVEGQQALQACLMPPGRDPSETQEQLVWLLQAASHCLADSCAGETALPPLAVLNAAEQGQVAAMAIMQLCRCLIEFPSLVLQPAWRPALSPRMMEAATGAVARWVDTYLMPDDPEGLPAGEMRATYSCESPPATAALDALVRVASTCLTSYPGEAQLHTQVITGLLPSLVRRRGLCRQLAGLPSWQELVGAFASRQPVLTQQLSHKLHRALARALMTAASGCPDAPSAQQYASQLLHTTVAQVLALAHAPNLREMATQAGVVVQLCCLLETMRGATRGASPRSQPALFAAAEQLLTPLLLLQGAFSSDRTVVALLLKLASDLVENHVSYLQPSQADVLLQWVLHVLQQYSGKTGLTVAPGRELREAQLAEQARELRALLSLLTHVTQRDLVDFGSAGTMQTPQFDVAQLVLLGLHILLPLMSQELLKFPKLCRLYFNLLTHMLEVYPEQFALLEAGHFTSLMQSLEFGLMHTDVVVLSCALEGLAGLAKYQFQAQQAGSPGLAADRPGGAALIGGESVVPHFTRLLLRRLLLEDAALDIVELAGDALLPLLLCDASTYQQVGTSLLQGKDAAAASKMSAALTSLLHSGGVMQDLSRQNRRRFRVNLCQMVADVRGLIHVR